MRVVEEQAIAPSARQERQVKGNGLVESVGLRRLPFKPVGRPARVAAPALGERAGAISETVVALIGRHDVDPASRATRRIPLRPAIVSIGQNYAPGLPLLECQA